MSMQSLASCHGRRHRGKQTCTNPPGDAERARGAGGLPPLRLSPQQQLKLSVGVPAQLRVVSVNERNRRVDLSGRSEAERAADKALAEKGAVSTSTGGLTALQAALARAGIAAAPPPAEADPVRPSLLAWMCATAHEATGGCSCGCCMLHIAGGCCICCSVATNVATLL